MDKRIEGAPLESYPPEDQAFYRFWYGHMLGDLMQPPLANIGHATARYIWDAARASSPSGASQEALTADAKDAARYRWLREQHWNNAEICCVANPKAAVRLGHDCPSLDRLDAAIDAAMEQQHAQEQEGAKE